MDKKGSKTLLIGLIIFILFIICIIAYNIYSNNKKFDSTINFGLIGEKEITIALDTEYVENGFYANSNSIDLREKVRVSGIVDTSKIGEYKITYSLTDSKNVTKTLTRIVKVELLDEFNLIGESEVYLCLNGMYTDQGYIAHFNKTDYFSQVIVSNNINYNVEGEYNINYKLPINNQELNRKIIVKDFKEYINFTYNESKSNESINVIITYDESKISKVIDFNGDTILNNSNTIISNNGNYKFLVYDKYNNSNEVVLEIKNISRELPVGTCSVKIENNKSTVTVNTNNEISKYYYNGMESNTNTYTFNNITKDVSVVLEDYYKNKNTIKCTTSVYSEKLEIHFIASGHYDDAILIRTDDKVVFIDGGRKRCSKMVIPYLQTLGVKKIDMMIGSHLDGDHIQAQADIIDKFTVDKVYYSDDIYTCSKTCPSDSKEYILPKLKEKGMKPIIVPAGTKLQLGELIFYFLGPWTLSETENNNSYLFIMQFRNNKFFFGGDSDGPMDNITKLEEYATKAGTNLDVDVFKYSHHGNAVYSDKTYAAFKPEITIVPNYYAPQYPKSSVQSYIKKYSKMYRQSDSKTGNITLISDGNTVSVYMNTQAENYKRS